MQSVSTMECFFLSFSSPLLQKPSNEAGRSTIYRARSAEWEWREKEIVNSETAHKLRHGNKGPKHGKPIKPPRPKRLLDIKIETIIFLMHESVKSNERTSRVVCCELVKIRERLSVWPSNSQQGRQYMSWKLKVYSWIFMESLSRLEIKMRW